MVIVIVYGQYQLVCVKVEFFGYIVIQYGLMLSDVRKSVTAAFTNKSKAVPLHAMEALGGERRYSSYSFFTSALDGDEWSASRPGRALPPGKGPRYPLYRRLGGPQSRSGHRG
jgi:hypothetical protein